MKFGLTYLAAPYSAETKEITEQRMQLLAQAQANLIAQRMFPVTPLSCHWVLHHCPNVPTDWGYWQHYSRALLEKCENFVIVDIDGWKTSEGVQAEFQQARNMGLDCYLYDVNSQQCQLL